MKKLLWVGAVGVAVFAFVAVAKAQDVGFENIFGSSVSVDLKVNGSDGPVKVDRGERIVVSWISEGATRCRGNWSKNDIKLSGTVAGKISKSVLVKVACINGEGDRDDDSVVVNVSGQTAVTTPIPVEQKEQKLAVFVASPEFGASVYEGDTISVLWRTNGTSGGDITLPTSISLRSIADGKSIELWRGGNSGAQKVTIPPQVLAPGQTGGKYEIDVTISANGRSFVGTSSVFSVIDPTQKPVPTTSAQPTLVSISPETGSSGTRVILVGSGFVPTAVVNLCGAEYQPVSVSSDGKAIVFVVPDDLKTKASLCTIYVSNKNGTYTNQDKLFRVTTAPTTSAQPMPKYLVVPLLTNELRVGLNTLYRFKVTAPTSDEIVLPLSDLYFSISKSNFSVYDIVLRVYTDSSYSQLFTNGIGTDGTFGTTGDFESTVTNFRSRLDSVRGNTIAIPAGATRYFELTGTVRVIPSGVTSSVSTVLWPKADQSLSLLTYSLVATPTTSAQPSITVTSPNGGQSYKAGDKINVSWTTKNISGDDTVYIELFLGNPSVGATRVHSFPTTVNNGIETVTLPSTLADRDDYYVHV
ncbi:MAG: hypothetical protein G01um101417_429, partial [Parcubacteria group bacterium Gr01-1014_17]